MDAEAKAKQLIETWLRETSDQPITLTIPKLAFLAAEALQEAEQVGRGHRAEVPALEEYYRQDVHLIIDRLTLLAIVGAGILALKHPGFVGPSSDLLRKVLKLLVPYVYEHTPAEVLQEWDRVLERGGD